MLSSESEQAESRLEMDDALNRDKTGTPVPHPQLFIVRLWWERQDEKSTGEWRGWVEHVPTRERRYFREIENVAEFIQGLLGKQQTDS